MKKNLLSLILALSLPWLLLANKSEKLSYDPFREKFLELKVNPTTVPEKNKNSIPNDPESPFVTSGIRIGSPAITTRGFKEDEARQVANLIADVLDHPTDEAVIAATKAKVHALTSRFPVYGA